MITQNRSTCSVSVLMMYCSCFKMTSFISHCIARQVLFVICYWGMYHSCCGSVPTEHEGKKGVPSPLAE